MSEKLPLPCILFLAFILNAKGQEQVTVSTYNAGTVTGKIVTGNNGQKYNVFLGIPYAQPPVGNLRFKPPVQTAVSSSTKVDASRSFSKVCMQGQGLPQPAQSEDCLYLNVMAPSQQPSDGSKYPVMVWIHGGAFIVGSAAQFAVNGTTNNIVSKGVIVVTINYRLGIFGLFTTESSAAPGNYGFLDQIAALKWVQCNIQHFGGDPNKVTLFGESAGGASASLLSISPLAKGLFKRMIAMSGSAFAPWATMYDDEQNDPSQTAMQLFGCRNSTGNAGNKQCPLSTYTPSSVNMYYSYSPAHNSELECMQRLSASDINTKMPLNFQWMARIDGTFLPQSIESLMTQRSSNLDILIGVDRDEYASFAFGFNLGDLSASYIQSRDEFLTQDSYLKLAINCKNFQSPEATIQAAQQFYINSAVNTDEKSVWFQRLVNMISAGMFWVPAYQDVIAASKTSANPVYLYSYDWKNSQVFINRKNNSFSGAGHASELNYLFGPGSFPLPSGKRDASFDGKMTDYLGTMWTNFAKYGNPTPQPIDGVTWQPFNSNRQNYLSIDNPMKMMDNFYRDDVKLWLNQRNMPI